MSLSRSQKRAADVRLRVSRPATSAAVCAVLDCGRPTMVREGVGLHPHYCRRHVEHYRRHGSYSKPSYTAGELKAYRQTATRWLREHQGLPEVREAIGTIKSLYRRAGRPVASFRRAGLPPAQCAAAHWAQLRERGVAPEALLAVWLAICLCHRADPQPERRVEFRWVQAAKVLHRLAGGSHKRWERGPAGGSRESAALHHYPASRGRVLRHLGEALAKAGRPMEHHLATLESLACDPDSVPRLPRVRPRAS